MAKKTTKKAQEPVTPGPGATTEETTKNPGDAI